MSTWYVIIYSVFCPFLGYSDADVLSCLFYVFVVARTICYVWYVRVIRVSCEGSIFRAVSATDAAGSQFGPEAAAVCRCTWGANGVLRTWGWMFQRMNLGDVRHHWNIFGNESANAPCGRDARPC